MKLMCYMNFKTLDTSGVMIYYAKSAGSLCKGVFQKLIGDEVQP